MKRLILIDDELHTYMPIYTIPEAVEKTGKSRATLYNWKKRGRIEFTNFGKKNVYISQAEIDRIEIESLMEEGYKVMADINSGSVWEFEVNVEDK